MLVKFRVRSSKNSNLAEPDPGQVPDILSQDGKRSGRKATMCSSKEEEEDEPAPPRRMWQRRVARMLRRRPEVVNPPPLSFFATRSRNRSQQLPASCSRATGIPEIRSELLKIPREISPRGMGTARTFAAQTLEYVKRTERNLSRSSSRSVTQTNT